MKPTVIAPGRVMTTGFGLMPVIPAARALVVTPLEISVARLSARARRQFLRQDESHDGSAQDSRGPARPERPRGRRLW